MSESVIEASTTRLMGAMEENLSGHVSFLQRRLEGMEVHEGGLVLVDSGLPSDTFNKILGARLEPTNADARIDEALAHFRRRNLPFSFWVGPCSRPLDLEERLKKRGLCPSEYELGMSIDLARLPEAPPLAEGFEMRSVRSEEELADFSGVLADLADPPDRHVKRFFQLGASILLQDDCPMRFYLAYSGAEPAAVSELFVGGGVAGIHMVATASKFRRRGLGMALTFRALEDGRRSGMASGVLQASAEGQPVYERLGFEPCGRFVEYAF